MQLHGTITLKYRSEKTQAAGDLIGALALEGSPEQGSPDAEISITRTTRVVRASAPANTPLTFDDLREGDRVMVVLACPAQETYPVRGIAAEVTVVG
jgi:hypothetical protein